MGTAALALGLRDGVPTALRFGCAVPLERHADERENGPADTSSTDPSNLTLAEPMCRLMTIQPSRAVRGLGDELGKGLIELHDVLTGATASVALAHMFGGDGQSFMSSLWESSRLRRGQPRSLRSSFLAPFAWERTRHIRLDGRPFGRAHPNLPAPFPPLLPPLSSEDVVGSRDRWLGRSGVYAPPSLKSTDEDFTSHL